MIGIRVASRCAAVIGLGIAIMAVAVAYFGVFDIAYTRALIVYASVVAVLLERPLAASVSEDRTGLRALAWLTDAAAVAAISLAIWTFLRSADDLTNMLVTYDSTDIAIGLLGAAVLLEVTRRLFGLPLFLFVIIVFAYGLLGDRLPAAIGHSGFSLNMIMEMVWYGFQGVFGMPLSIVIQVVLVFVVFGVLLEGTGASTSLIRIAFAITGRTRGGVGHAAIVSSALFGSMSGSVVANVVGTGTFTIPMMVRRGFRPATAGAIEAAASTGGQIMPPVMGAAAFLMADLLGTPYLHICMAALVPALLFYGALFVSVALEARKAGIEPIPAAERERIDRATLTQSLMFTIPIVVVIATLIMGRSPAMAGFCSVVAVILTALALNPDLRRHPVRLLAALANAGLAGASIVVAVAAIGIILGTINLTGIGLTFASTVAALGESHLLLALLLTALTCLILGMGMPTLPAYLIIVLVMGRSLRELGIDPLAIHMFVFYFGVLSAITPPVAVAIFAASPIAKAPPLATAGAAMRIAFVGFVIPFVFAVEPNLLLVVGEFDPWRFGLSLLGLCTMILGLATAFYGYDSVALGVIRRLVRTAIGLAPLAAILTGRFEPPVIVACAALLAADIGWLARTAGRRTHVSQPMLGRTP